MNIFSYNIMCICVYKGVHYMFFLSCILRSQQPQVQISLPGWLLYIGDRLIYKALKVLPLSLCKLSDLFWLGWKLRLSRQVCGNRLIRWTGKCLQKNNQEISPLFEEVSVPFKHDTGCVILKVVYKLSGRWCHFFEVWVREALRRGESFMIDTRAALRWGTGETALGNHKDPT